MITRTSPSAVIVQVVGYISQPQVDRNEYWDWNGKSLYLTDIELGLKNDAFPPGLVFRDGNGLTAVVCSDRRTLRPIPAF